MASRTSNSIKNIASSLGLKFLMLGLQFATRTIFINNLGSVYNGINSLVSSILSFLNITELGIGAAIVYAMYKPIADKDEEKTLQYLEYYKKVYHVMGLAILALGLVLLPFFPYLAKGAGDVATTTELYVVYGLYLLQSVSSFYVYAYRGGLISAYQQDYRLTPINYTASILIVVLQGCSLLFLQGMTAFYVYVALPIVISCVRSLLNGIFAQKWYPYIKRKPQGKLSKEEIKGLYKNVLGLALSKVCAIVNSSADSIIISALIGVTVLGKYQNYQTLILMVGSFVGILFTSLVPSIGNLQAEGSKEHSKKVFDTVYFISFFIYGVCAVCYFCIVQPFVRIWIGEANMLFDNVLLIVICLNFLTDGLCSAVSAFRSGCGLFYEGRYRPVFTVIFNVVFSVLLGYFWGITGIILATIFSRLLTVWWFDAYIVFKHAFGKKVYGYLATYLANVAAVCLLGAAAFWVCSLIPVSGWAQIFVNAGVALVISVPGILLISCRSSGFGNALSYVKIWTKKLLRRC